MTTSDVSLDHLTPVEIDLGLDRLLAHLSWLDQVLAGHDSSP